MQKKNFVLMLSFVLLIPCFIRASEESTEGNIFGIIKETFKECKTIEFSQKLQFSGKLKTKTGCLLSLDLRSIDNIFETNQESSAKDTCIYDLGALSLTSPKGSSKLIPWIPFKDEFQLMTQEKKEGILKLKNNPLIGNVPSIKKLTYDMCENDPEEVTRRIECFKNMLLGTSLTLEFQKRLSNESTYIYAIKKIGDLELPALNY